MEESKKVDRSLGLLRVRLLRGVNLAVRDFFTSDPYVVLRMGKQKLKSRVIKRNVNPEWNEELTLYVEDPSLPVKLKVYDKDTFSFDDPMGNAEFDIRPLFDVSLMDLRDFPDGSIVKKLIPNRKNCLAEESLIHLENGKILQDMFLRLRNVERGEIELQLQWISIPTPRCASLDSSPN
ncbi:hypothetical protein HPP92_008669 [Vanilla planifolia]|uniref:C2 domain-containing protein n=1 Tax=Vanilla planifolia TaxID=51239 RepID=A0A835RE56_VANPL|nr:hypothetical protein HPP92_008867 [Vanilla planifolia]KAG0486574.1 hypothetical protein HPP92_008669 [Vanilla planifolia]